MALKESEEFKEHADKINICDDAAKVLQYLIQSTPLETYFKSRGMNLE